MSDDPKSRFLLWVAAALVSAAIAGVFFVLAGASDISAALDDAKTFIGLSTTTFGAMYGLAAVPNRAGALTGEDARVAAGSLIPVLAGILLIVT